MSIRLNTAAGLLAVFRAGLLPAAAAAQTKLLRVPGHDLQLERTVEELVKKMDAGHMELPRRPADPVKTK